MSSRPERDTRRRILHEAEDAFAERGFAGASLSGVARTVGIGNPGLLHHFPSKSALYRAVLVDIGEDIDRRNAAALAAGNDPAAQLRGLVDVLIEMYRARPTALMIVAQEFLDRTGRVTGAGTLPLRGVVRATRSVIEAGQALGQVRQGDALILTSLIHGALLNGLLGRDVYSRMTDEPHREHWEEDLAQAVSDTILIKPSPLG
ncbi:TetR/AcrR family transcriptional regulator [Nocardia sp. NPDC023852]|uniref:TetR/AcrR family transcriptional regulator n=1 Tax=Nocardia sp. NPDC023852 TaxID=3154697 RepID=UPI0033EC740B